MALTELQHGHRYGSQEEDFSRANERNSISEQSLGEDTGDDTEESSRMSVVDSFINDGPIEVMGGL